MKKSLTTQITLTLVLVLGLFVPNFFIVSNAEDEIECDGVTISDIVDNLGIEPIELDDNELFGSTNSSVSYTDTKYDPRTLNKVSPVDDQGAYGICWDYSIQAMAEQYLINVDGYTNKTNLSESYFYLMNADKGYSLTSGYSQVYFRKSSSSTYYLASEANYPDTELSKRVDASGNVTPLNKAEVIAFTKNAEYRLNYFYILDNDTDKIKSAITSFGGACVDYYCKSSDLNKNNIVTYNGYKDYLASNATTSDGTDGGHAVIAVGWDDSINGGSFLCKNSWGTNSYWDGYFWLPYTAVQQGYAFSVASASTPVTEYLDMTEEVQFGTWVDLKDYCSQVESAKIYIYEFGEVAYPLNVKDGNLEREIGKITFNIPNITSDKVDITATNTVHDYTYNGSTSETYDPEFKYLGRTLDTYTCIYVNGDRYTLDEDKYTDYNCYGRDTMLGTFYSPIATDFWVYSDNTKVATCTDSVDHLSGNGEFHIVGCGDANIVFKIKNEYLTNGEEVIYKFPIHVTCSNCSGDGSTIGENLENCTHDYKAPTCTSSGHSQYYCSICGNYSKYETLDATGHDYELTASSEATCRKEGETKYTCKNCGISYTESTSTVSCCYVHNICKWCGDVSDDLSLKTASSLSLTDKKDGKVIFSSNDIDWSKVTYSWSYGSESFSIDGAGKITAVNPTSQREYGYVSVIYNDYCLGSIELTYKKTTVSNTSNAVSANSKNSASSTVTNIAQYFVKGVPSTKRVKYAKLSKGKVTFSVAPTRTNCMNITYLNKSSSKLKKYLKVGKNGKVTLKKGAKKGTYKVWLTFNKTTTNNCRYYHTPLKVTITVK